MIAEWLSLRKHPILAKSTLGLSLLQLHFIWLIIRRPKPKANLDFRFLRQDRGPVWRNLNAWLRFQLQFIDAKLWPASPVIRGVALVNLNTSYKSDECRIPSDKRQTIDSLSEKYARTFDVITRPQFRNWITRNFLIATAFSEFNVDPVSDSECLIEIGPGLGAIISLALESGCEAIYSLDTFEMHYIYGAVSREFPEKFDRVKQITVNDIRTLRPFTVPNQNSTVLAFWSFTELTESERKDYFGIFGSAKRIIIGCNKQFEGVDNFQYIENLAKTLDMDLRWKTLGEIFTTEIPSYQKSHRIYLLLARQ